MSATLVEAARRAGVSTATVAGVVNGSRRVSTALLLRPRSRIRGAMRAQAAAGA